MAHIVERQSVAAQDSGRRRAGSRDELTELRRQNAELAEGISARDRFISVAAHELRNPMTSMFLRVQQLVNIVQSSTDVDKHGRMSRELARLEQLMTHYIKRATMLLEFSRFAAGKLRLDPEPIDFAKFLRSAIEDLTPAVQHTGSPLSLDVPAEVHGVWDRLAIEQIIDNVLSNAIKFGEGRPIEIALRSTEETMSFRVRDHGMGIAKADQPHIFERFRRGQGAQPHIGFGVGLWLVRQLVRAMGGRIDLVSASGAGSTFTITLPLAPNSHADLPKGALPEDCPRLND